MIKSITRNRFICGATAFALAAMTAIPVTAFAANGGSTSVTLEADSSNINVTVPATIPMTVDGAGAIVTSGSHEISNESMFNVQLTEFQTTAQGSFNIVSDAASGGDNALELDMTIGGGSPVDLATTLAGKTAAFGADGNLDYAGGASDTKSVSISGKAANLNADVSSATEVATLSWTFAPGSHA